MKDTEAFAVVLGRVALLSTLEGCREFAELRAQRDFGNFDAVSVEPVVIVSKARYEALETCERIVHGRAIAMCEERGAEGETKERELPHKADLSVNWH